MKKIFAEYGSDYRLLLKKTLEEALTIDREDVEINKKMGENGAGLLKSGQTVLTYCNAGALATAGFGTALGVIRAAISNQKEIQVIASETRPYLQGARLTVWELQEDNIPVKLITDNMAGYLMSQNKIDLIITGADRIAANGDTANKIGTFSLAVLAKYHKIPFYVAAPLSTIDLDCPGGNNIPIEQRDKEEVINFMNQRIARPQTEVFYPAFDVTPHHLITAIITEKSVISGNYSYQIKKLFSE
jgi:methylthioribose-1-phosphate isomerase